MLNDLKNTLVNMEMSLDELVFERLDMTYEDLLYELHHRLVERVDHFEDVERITEPENYSEDSDAEENEYDRQMSMNFEDEE